MLRGSIITCVRTVKTRAVPFFMVRSARSGVVLVILAAMRGMEELASKQEGGQGSILARWCFNTQFHLA